MNHPAWIEVDLAKFRRNLSHLMQKVSAKRFCCVVKGNAYGHGIVPIGREAEKAGVHYLGVAHLKEAAHLREAGVKIPILVMGAIHENQIEDLIRYQVEMTLSSKFKAELVAAKCRELKARCRVHVEVDTGMQRTGVRPESAPALIDYLQSQNCFELCGVYSHFVNARLPNDPTTLSQIEQFRALQKQLALPNLIWHLANSGGAAFFSESQFDMVRIGLLCYGLVPDGMPVSECKNPQSSSAHLYPEEIHARAQQLDASCRRAPHEPPRANLGANITADFCNQTLAGLLEPIFSLKARIAYFKVVAAGHGISYGHTYRTQNQTRVVTIPVGYGDGYRTSLSNKMSILLRGKRYPIAGQICMDQFMVDIGNDEAYVGDEVVLLGKQGDQEISISEMAQIAGADRRELLCHFNDRLPRIYTM